MKAFTTRRIGDIARSAYGGVSAMLQGDGPGSEVMARDVAETCDDVDEALWAVAIFTLERLDAASPRGDNDSVETDELAAGLIEFAEQMAPTALSVRAAAVRLYALRSGDLDGFAAATAGLHDVATDTDLLMGALALLTATLHHGATRRDRRPEEVCRELCTAAMLAADG